LGAQVSRRVLRVSVRAKAGMVRPMRRRVFMVTAYPGSVAR
jgi:hypothetical protein